MADNEKKVKDEQALENRCPACKASIKFNPKVGKFKCEYCGSEFTLEEMQKHSDNASTEEKNQPKEKQIKIKKGTVSATLLLTDRLERQRWTCRLILPNI